MTDQSGAPIALFDSGAGGLSVLLALKRLLPDENYIYFGDRSNAPYGDKTHEEIRRIALGNAKMLFERGAKALVIACNTATAAAVESIRAAYPDKPVIGIEPAVKPAFSSGCKKIAVLATPRTVSEERFKNLLLSYSGIYGGTAVGIGCPGLSTAVEEGTVTVDYFRRLFGDAFGDGMPDGIVLGCTHYPFAKKEITEAAGAGIPVFDGADGTARHTMRRLEAAGLLNKQSRPGTVEMVGDDGFLAGFWQKHCPVTN